MTTAQTRFFDALDELAAKHGHEVVQEASHANTGRVALVRAGSFEETISFRYSFSTGHNVFEHARLGGAYRQGEGPALDAQIFSTETGSNPRMDIARSPGELARILDAVEAVLTRTTTEGVTA